MNMTSKSGLVNLQMENKLLEQIIKEVSRSKNVVSRNLELNNETGELSCTIKSSISGKCLCIAVSRPG